MKRKRGNPQKSRKRRRQAKCWTKPLDVEFEIEPNDDDDEEGSGMEILIQPTAKRKLDAFTDLATGEISGLGIVSSDKGTLTIEDIFILEQECTSSTSDLTEQGVTDLVHQLIVDGKDPSLVKLWWHSHDTMQTFWSGTDEGTAAKFGNGWMISIVTNRKREYLCRLDVYEPVHLKLDNITLKEVAEVRDPDFLDMIRSEIRQKVIHRGYVYRGGQGSGYNTPGVGVGYTEYNRGFDDWQGYNGAHDDHEELAKRAADSKRYASTETKSKDVGFISGSRVTKMAEIKAASREKAASKEKEEHLWPTSGKK